MQNQPLVTVYIPTFNRVELLKRAVKSVQDQTYKNLEIIIVDDCSTDGTHEYLEQVSKEDKRVRFFLKETNSGACVSRNIAIENATGEFITGLDDDDYFKENRIALFIKYCKKYDMTSTVLYSMYEDSTRKSGMKIFFKKYLLKKNVSQYELLMNNYIGNQIFVKTNLLLEIGGFDQKLKMWQDLECWYRLLNRRKAILVRKSTYLLDIDHTMGRISDSKKNVLVETFEYFSKKHSLDFEQKKMLRTHFFYYGFIDLSITLFVKRVFISMCIWDSILVFKLILAKLKKW